MFLSGCKKSLYTVPELSIGVISDITFASANCNYTIISDGGRTISARGICWSTEQSPTVEDNKTTDDTWDPTFTSSMTGLSYNTTYYVRSYATNSEGTAYSEEISFKTLNPGLPNVTTSGVTDITENSATCGGNVISSGGTGVAVIARGLCWSTSPNPTITNNHSTNGSGLGTFSYNITGLTFNTTYYVRAYAVNGVGVAYGNEVFFTAGQSITSPIVTTNSGSNISYTTATSGGYVSSDGGATVTARGVCWNTSQNPTIVNSNTINGNGIGVFTSPISGLSPNITYYVRAFATNIAGTAYGNEVSFNTLALTTPTVITTNITNISQTTATTGGNVTNDGGAAILDRGVCWSTNINPTLIDNYSTDGTGTGSFTSNLIGLAQGITYYVRAYATNSIGTAYGSQVSFTTLNIPTLTTNSITNIGMSTATSGGNITSDGGSTITERGICWNSSPNPLITDSHTTDGNGIGIFTSNMTGLSLNVIYYVRSYATNGQGTAYGNELTFSTVVAIGDSYQGGIIAYILQPGDPGYIAGQIHGIIAAPSDQSTGAQWGCDGTTIGTSSLIGAGLSNTNAIVNGCPTAGIAARLCYNLVLGGYNDWYLPSKNELNMLYLNRSAIGIGPNFYWSSSEYSSSAWAQLFLNGGQFNGYDKTYLRYVRAVRSF